MKSQYQRTIFRGIKMRIDDQLLFVGLLWPFSFLTIRQILGGVKELYLSKHEKKRRKKGQSFKEWFLYSRYRDGIPTVLLWLYFIVVIAHPIFFAFVCVAYFIPMLQKVSSIVTIIIIAFDVIWIFAIWLLTWKPGDPAAHYEYLVTKPKKKKKK